MWPSETELLRRILMELEQVNHKLKHIKEQQENLMATLATLQAAITQEGNDITSLQTAITSLGGFITGQLTSDINTIIADLQSSGGNPSLIAQLQALVQQGDAAVQQAATTIGSAQSSATAADSSINAADGNQNAPANNPAGS